MSYEILIILFIVFSVISSLINKLQESRRVQDREAAGRRSRSPSGRPAPPVYEPEEEEIDLSELDIPVEPEPPRVEPRVPEFREVAGRRPVSEADTGPEFREVSGRRPVKEMYTGREFQEVRGKRTVVETSPFAGAQAEVTPEVEALSAAMADAMRSVRKGRRIRLDLKPGALRRAILYQEVLGPPRAEQMPW